MIFTEKIHGFKLKDLILFIVSNVYILNKIKDTYKKLYNNKLIDEWFRLSIFIGK